MSEAAAIDTYRFSTNALPEPDRAAMWREVFGRKIAGIDLEPVGDAPLSCDVDYMALGEVATSVVRITGFRGGRTRELMSDSRDDVSLVAPVRGSIFVRQLGRELVIGEGEAATVRTTEVGETFQPARSDKARGRYLHISVPAKALVQLVPQLDTAVMRLIPARNNALRLLHNYAAFLYENRTLIAPDTADSMATHFTDLCASALGAGQAAQEIIDGRGMRAARLRSVKAIIGRYSGDCRLSLESAAMRARISPGYVRKLFASEGTSFTEFVLAHRLIRAHGMLRDPALVHLGISAIAFDAGFGDLSYFNRTFRRRYGATPSEVRSAIAVQ